MTVYSFVRFCRLCEVILSPLAGKQVRLDFPDCMSCHSVASLELHGKLLCFITSKASTYIYIHMQSQLTSLLLQSQRYSIPWRCCCALVPESRQRLYLYVRGVYPMGFWGQTQCTACITGANTGLDWVNRDHSHSWLSLLRCLNLAYSTLRSTDLKKKNVLKKCVAEECRRKERSAWKMLLLLFIFSTRNYLQFQKFIVVVTKIITLLSVNYNRLAMPVENRVRQCCHIFNSGFNDLGGSVDLLTKGAYCD